MTLRTILRALRALDEHYRFDNRGAAANLERSS